MELTKEQIIAQYKKLPQDLQEMVVSEDVGLQTQLIGRDTGITPEQALDVEDEIVAILMGTSHPKDFIRNIQTKIGVDDEKARTIAEKVNEEIFQLVKESLKIVHNIGEEASLASTASGASQALTPAPRPPTAPQAPTPTPPSPQFPQMIVPGGVNVPEAPKSSQNIFEQKLQGVFKMPKEETLVPPRPTDNRQQGGVDPYREPAA